MKVRIDGCTAEELAEQSPYLSLGMAYEVHKEDGSLVYFMDEHGGEVVASLAMGRCGHIPRHANWIVEAE